jgi:hypothetical protein
METAQTIGNATNSLGKRNIVVKNLSHNKKEKRQRIHKENFVKVSPTNKIGDKIPIESSTQTMQITSSKRKYVKKADKIAAIVATPKRKYVKKAKKAVAFIAPTKRKYLKKADKIAAMSAMPKRKYVKKANKIAAFVPKRTYVKKADIIAAQVHAAQVHAAQVHAAQAKHVAHVTTHHDEKFDAVALLNKKVKEGNPEYIKFQKFLQAHPDLDIKSALFLVNTDVASKKGHSPDDFKLGELKITNLTKINTYARAIVKTKKYFSNYNDIKFVKAFVALITLPKYNHNKMMKRLTLKVALPKIGEPRLKICDSVDSYKNMLIDLYNYHIPAKSKLAFAS